jgi:hypothetical protein
VLLSASGIFHARASFLKYIRTRCLLPPGLTSTESRRCTSARLLIKCKSPIWVGMAILCFSANAWTSVKASSWRGDREGMFVGRGWALLPSNAFGAKLKMIRESS